MSPEEMQLPEVLAFVKELQAKLERELNQIRNNAGKIPWNDEGIDLMTLHVEGVMNSYTDEQLAAFGIEKIEATSIAGTATVWTKSATGVPEEAIWFYKDLPGVEEEDWNPGFNPWKKDGGCSTKQVPEVCPCGIKVETGLCTYHPKEGW